VLRGLPVLPETNFWVLTSPAEIFIKEPKPALRQADFRLSLTNIFNSPGISGVRVIYGGILVVEPPKYPHISSLPLRFPKTHIFNGLLAR